MIPYGDIEIGEKLGSGGQGTVYQGNYAGEIVAIKKFLTGGRKETSHLRHLNHQNLIQFRTCIPPKC